MGKEEYSVYYKNKKYWRFHGTYTKTDALGTANLILKAGDTVLIRPLKQKNIKGESDE